MEEKNGGLKRILKTAYPIIYDGNKTIKERQKQKDLDRIIKEMDELFGTSIETKLFGTSIETGEWRNTEEGRNIISGIYDRDQRCSQ